jgi:hypothetical protein
MVLGLFVVYVGLSFLNDTHGFLGTDTGGKVATLRVMDQQGRLDPDLKYWAEQWDPNGTLHPLFYTFHWGTRWMNATTLPVLYAALPLYEALGYRGALVLPMLGSVAAALAARALAQRLGSKHPDRVFWVVGLASPLTVYALDFWEHSIGVALLLWAGVALVDAVGRRSWKLAFVAGVLFGAAFSLRTEALVYAAVAGAFAAWIAWRRAGPACVARLGAAMAGGALLSVGLDALLDQATVGRLIRLSRAGGAAAGAGGSGGTVPGSRISDAIATTVNLRASLDGAAYLQGAVLLLCLVMVVARFRRGSAEPDRRLLVGYGAVIALLYLTRFHEGPGFVPGLFAATPIAAVALVCGWQTPLRRTLTIAALSALPLVWIFQFVGGAAPQWAGRYELPTTIVLLIVGAVGLEALPRWLARSFIGLSVGVTLFGVVWLGQRSHDVGEASRAVNRLPQPVLVSSDAHLFREMGGSYDPSARRLTAVTRADQDRAATVVHEAGFHEFGFIDLDSDPVRQFSGYRAGDVQFIQLFDHVRLRVTTYRDA